MFWVLDKSVIEEKHRRIYFCWLCLLFLKWSLKSKNLYVCVCVCVCVLGGVMNALFFSLFLLFSLSLSHTHAHTYTLFRFTLLWTFPLSAVWKRNKHVQCWFLERRHCSPIQPHCAPSPFTPPPAPPRTGPPRSPCSGFTSKLPAVLTLSFHFWPALKDHFSTKWLKSNKYC